MPEIKAKPNVTFDPTMRRRWEAGRIYRQMLSPGTMLARKLSHHVVLNAAEREALDAILGRNVRHLENRALLADPPAVPTEIHVLIEGYAARVATLPSGRRQIVAIYLPGDVCDFDVFLMRQMDQAIVAIGPVRVATIDRRTLSELSRTQPRVAHALWWESMVTAAIQRAWTINIGSRGARERLAHLLCELHARSALVGLAEDGACPLPLTQADLGDACAMTAIHTNRALQRLRGDGLIALSNGVLELSDAPAVRALAQFDGRYLQVSAPAEFETAGRDFTRHLSVEATAAAD